MIRFVTPPLEGTPTGGTLYDARLLGALQSRGVSALSTSLSEATSRASTWSDALWVDSLFLAAMPGLARAASGNAALLLHYLPSLVEHGAAWTPAALSDVEHAALESAARILVPSPWLARVVESAGIPGERLFVVEPGVDVAPGTPEVAPSASAELRAVILANLVVGKGILPFLRALERELAANPARLVVTVVGSPDLDPAYAAACRAVTTQSWAHFRGSLSAQAAQAVLAESDVFVSASRMESYGMALAEARALGVPIVALRGGNASAHVDPRAGGALASDDAALASSLVRLARDPAELASRRHLARGARRARTWEHAARDFVAGAACS